jgi:phage terminase small subunit
MKGRKKKPLAIVRLEGNPGKRKLPSKAEEVTAVPGAPMCPDWLNAAAKTEWARVVPLMNAQGTLAQIDMAIIAGYCHCYAMVVKYRASKVPAEQNLAIKYLQRMQSFASLLGLSPSDRAKLSIPGRKVSDEMEELLAKDV